jgi:hypothetical protein
MSNAHENTSKKQMSDIEMARGYVLDIGGRTSVQVMLARAYTTLAEMFPHKDDPKNQWTERRVKSFWWRDAATVQFREMLELHRAAEKAKEERELLQKARKEHAAFIEKTASYRALLERTDQDFFGGEIERLGSQLGGMDRS